LVGWLSGSVDGSFQNNSNHQTKINMSGSALASFLIWGGIGAMVFSANVEGSVKWSKRQWTMAVLLCGPGIWVLAIVAGIVGFFQWLWKKLG
jgi:hypothetical protein